MPPLAYPVQKSFPAKLSNETGFKMDSIMICTRLLVNQNTMHLVSGQQRAEGFNSAIHSLSINKANPEKI